MKKLLFIINPIAGVQKKKNIPQLIKEHLDTSTLSYEIVLTEYAGHGKVLAKEAINTFDVVVAVGGDGTVNEIASALRHSKTALGIIPMGSGNGLARHLKIPLNTIEAIQFLSTSTTRNIDTCTLNDLPFFCTAGVGFDGYIGDVFSKQTSRGFWTYFKCSVRDFFRYSPKTYSFNNKDVTAYLITVANANQFGNDVFISPLSNIEDGKFEVCVVKPFSFWAGLFIGLKLFRKKIHTSNYYDFTSQQEVIVENPSNEFVHLDGEPIGQLKKLHFKIFPQSLFVIA
jgi:YegS/Rv2252/BmrU family lipid kinase